MKKIIMVLSLLMLISCSSGSKAATIDSFYAVEVGMSEKELVKKMGEPVSKKNLEGGYIEYVYIERMFAGERVVREKKYLVILKNGKVTSKKSVYENPPIYDRNSYDMQTSSNLEDK